MTAEILTQERLKQLLRYNPDSGVFKWKENRSNKALVGTVAGRKFDNKRGNKSIKIMIDGIEYLAHRLVWLYLYGHFPENDIDHINGNGYDNGRVNLRDVSRAVNNKNKAKYKSNTSGCAGVYWSNGRNKWVSQICVNKITVHLGRYVNFFDACCARKSAENTHGFHCNHGRVN